jgi:exodeoxyribonuclease X
VHDLTTLIKWTSEPGMLIRVPFGRDTRGKKWTEVDDGFLLWVLERDFSEDVLFTAKLELERREKAERDQDALAGEDEFE